MTALLNYDNLFLDPGATITGISPAGFEKENAYDWIGATFWKPGAGDKALTAQFSSSTLVNYFAIAAHNLGSEGCTLHFQYSADGSTWFAFSAPITPTDDTPIMVYNPTGVSDLWFRIVIVDCTADTVIGIASFGVGLELPSPIPPGSWAPPPYATKYETQTNVADGGAFLGRSIRRKGITGRIQQDLVPVAWIEANWRPLIEHLAKKPAFYCWDYENAITTDTALVWTIDEISKPDRYEPLFYRFNIPINGTYD